MGRIRDRNRFRKTYPFKRARVREPVTRYPVRPIAGVSPWASTIGGDDYIISITSTAGGTLTLPPARSLQQGEPFIVKDDGGNAAVNNITIAVGDTTTDTIDGGTTYVITKNYQSISIIKGTGNTWIIV